MLVLIVAVVALGAIFVVGALVGSSVAHNAAGDRARRRQRDLRLADLRTGAFDAGVAAPRAVSSRDVLTRDVVGHATR